MRCFSTLDFIVLHILEIANCHSSDGAIWISHDKRHKDKTKIFLLSCFFPPTISVGMRLSFTVNIFTWSALSFGGIQ